MRSRPAHNRTQRQEASIRLPGRTAGIPTRRTRRLLPLWQIGGAGSLKTGFDLVAKQKVLSSQSSSTRSRKKMYAANSAGLFFRVRPQAPAGRLELAPRSARLALFAATGATFITPQLLFSFVILEASFSTYPPYLNLLPHYGTLN
jgi:hypothetical protein